MTRFVVAPEDSEQGSSAFRRANTENVAFGIDTVPRAPRPLHHRDAERFQPRSFGIHIVNLEYELYRILPADSWRRYWA
jgi:hypothetical protein